VSGERGGFLRRAPSAVRVPGADGVRLDTRAEETSS
jgi:hypothetical protein